MEIMFNDLRPKKQEEVLSFLGLENPQEGNYDSVPLFVIADIQTTSDGEQACYDRVVISLLTTR